MIELFALVLTGCILDSFREDRIDIEQIAKGERLLHGTNQYGLSVVNGVEFKRDYFIFERNRSTKAQMEALVDNIQNLQ